MRFSAPQGRHLAPMGMKFGLEEWTEVPLLRAKFHPYLCNDKITGPQKLKILLKFYQISKYKRPKRGISFSRFSRNLHSLCVVSDALAVKPWMDLFERLRSYGGFKLRRRVNGFPTNLQRPLATKLCVGPKSFGGTRTCSRSLSPCQVWWFCGFGLSEADRMKTFRWNLACQRRPYVYCLVPNLAWVSKGALLQESPKCTNYGVCAYCRFCSGSAMITISSFENRYALGEVTTITVCIATRFGTRSS